MNSELNDLEYFSVFSDFDRAQEAHHLHKIKQRKLRRRERAVLKKLKKEQHSDEEIYLLEIRELRVKEEMSLLFKMPKMNLKIKLLWKR